jgi:alpha-ketoglutarate-dependent taurine dioxygenase
MQNGYERITVEPIAAACGAEIGGVDIGAGVDDETAAEIRRALLAHLVVFFRDQAFDEAQHKAFTRHFGELFVHPNYNFGNKDPELVFLLRRPGDSGAAGENWHADTTMMAAPPMGAILYGMEVPPYGADTLFANQYLAYDALSEGMKALLEKLRAVHNDSRVAGPNSKVNAQRSSKVRDDADWRPTEAVHPVVRTHPETGRKCLWVNGVYVHRFEGMSVEESQPLLDFLYAHCARPEFTCRFRWRPGSVAFWDNRCLQHLAVHDNFSHTRHMRRTQIRGSAVA